MVIPGTLIKATCETDSANPPAYIMWTSETALLQNSLLYKINSTEVLGNYNANKSSSSISFYVTTQFHGSSFTFGCFVDSFTEWTTVTLLGKKHEMVMLRATQLKCF